MSAVCICAQLLHQPFSWQVQQTVSDDLPNGVTVLTLYTMEMAPMDDSDDYLSLMNKNLDNLKTGLGC